MVKRAAINREMSSFMPSRRAAENPIADHNIGITRMTMGIFFSLHNIIPKVNIVVGHGKPKEGDLG